MQGLGQFHGEFASPSDVDDGVATWSQMTGVDAGHPYVGGPSVGGFAPDPAGSTGLVRIGAGNGGAMAPEAAGLPQHYSELWNFSESPLPYFLLLALLFFGVVQFTVGGQFRVGKK